MRSRGDVFEAEGRSDAGSSRSQEETCLKENHSNSRHGSQSSRNEELGEPIEYTDHERAELIRMLDSIKDHLLRGGGSGNALDKPKEPFLRPIHLHGPNPGTSYYHPCPEPFPYPQGSQDPYGIQIHRRPPPTPIQNWDTSGHYTNQMTRPYPGGQYVEPHSYSLAKPSKHSDVSSYSPVSSHHRGEKITTPYTPHVDNSSSSPGPRGGYGRWPSDLDSEMDRDFARGYVKEGVSDSDARRCHPLAGGAPFIACHSCFEVLYLHKKKLLTQERQHKLQCGACSEVISFTIVDKKLVFSSGNKETSSVSPEVEDRSTVEELSGSDFQRKDEEEPIQELRNHHETMQSIRSESQHSYNEERSSISSEQQQKEVKSVRSRVKSSKAPEPAAPESASLLELFEYSNVNRAALAYGMAQLGYNKPDKKESFMKQDSLKPESVATETDVSYNGYSNTEITEDSRYTNGREDNNNIPRSRKGSESSSTEITTDRNKDQMKSLEVWINGHLIPEDLVSNAEKLAGQVQAGKYWYDYRAGFWGVIGTPCLGVIPPFIEEFNYSMPSNCAAGNTEVYVNGRELNKRDFDLLVGRGLPQDKNRSYIVDISGRIIDEDSGEQLKSLGKLAPTIQKAKHGFGMRVPRSLAATSG